MRKSRPFARDQVQSSLQTHFPDRQRRNITAGNLSLGRQSRHELGDLFGRQWVYANILFVQLVRQVVILLDRQHRLDGLSGDGYGIEIDLGAFPAEVLRDAFELALEDVTPLSPRAIGQLHSTLEGDAHTIGTRVQVLYRTEVAQFVEQLKIHSLCSISRDRTPSSSKTGALA